MTHKHAPDDKWDNVFCEDVGCEEPECKGHLVARCKECGVICKEYHPSDEDLLFIDEDYP